MRLDQSRTRNIRDLRAVPVEQTGILFAQWTAVQPGRVLRWFSLSRWGFKDWINWDLQNLGSIWVYGRWSGNQKVYLASFSLNQVSNFFSIVLKILPIFWSQFKISTHMKYPFVCLIQKLPIIRPKIPIPILTSFITIWSFYRRNHLSWGNHLRWRTVQLLGHMKEIVRSYSSFCDSKRNLLVYSEKASSLDISRVWTDDHKEWVWWVECKANNEHFDLEGFYSQFHTLVMLITRWDTVKLQLVEQEWLNLLQNFSNSFMWIDSEFRVEATLASVTNEERWFVRWHLSQNCSFESICLVTDVISWLIRMIQPS
jgi:hypothetical protein